MSSRLICLLLIVASVGLGSVKRSRFSEEIPPPLKHIAFDLIVIQVVIRTGPSFIASGSKEWQSYKLMWPKTSLPQILNLAHSERWKDRWIFVWWCQRTRLWHTFSTEADKGTSIYPVQPSSIWCREPWC